MKITYLYHSGFLAELEHTVLLFDYYKGDLPKISQNKSLFVFVSHRHPDHFNPEIFSLVKIYKNIRYIISDDIWQNRVPEELVGRTVFMGPDEEELIRTESGRGGKLFIHTYRSTDEGVAFLVDVENTRIYHAGDLNDWHWDGEDKAWNNNQKKNYNNCLDAMKKLIKGDGLEIETAFVPVDKRLGDWYYLGMDEFMKKVGAKHVFPMHTSDDGSVAEELKKREDAKSYADRVINLSKCGAVVEL